MRHAGVSRKRTEGEQEMNAQTKSREEHLQSIINTQARMITNLEAERLFLREEVKRLSETKEALHKRIDRLRGGLQTYAKKGNWSIVPRLFKKECNDVWQCEGEGHELAEKILQQDREES